MSMWDSNLEILLKREEVMQKCKIKAVSFLTCKWQWQVSEEREGVCGG